MGDEIKKVSPGIRFLDRKIRTGASDKARAAELATKKQQQQEDIRLAEATSDVATAEAAATSKRSGRRSLIKTSPSGLASNLGGT